MIEPFFRRPRTVREWQERGRWLKQQIDRLSIDELFRGRQVGKPPDIGVGSSHHRGNMGMPHLRQVCLMYQDGDTEVSLGHTREVNPGGRPIFDGLLETPNRKVNVETAEGELVLQSDVPTERTRVQVWTNALQEPDKIIIGLG